MAEDEKTIQEFNRARQQLLLVSNQKQQLQMQVAAMSAALKELEETNEEKVYKIVGNVMLKKDKTEVKKELEEAKKNLESRIETLQKQEDSLVNRLNKLKAKLEKSAESKESSA